MAIETRTKGVVHLTDHRRQHELTAEQIQNLLRWMEMCRLAMEGHYTLYGPLSEAEATAASLATRKVLEADGCHLNFEDGMFVAYRGHISYR